MDPLLEITPTSTTLWMVGSFLTHGITLFVVIFVCLPVGVIRAIDRPMGYEVFNLGNGRPFLLSDFIRLVERCVGKRAIIQVQT
jgi:hypothetical protein